MSESNNNPKPIRKKHLFEKQMSLRTIMERRRELNRSRFPSEMWFEKNLKGMGIGGYRRNSCLMRRFFGDFVWRSKKLVVEIDGKSHNKQKDYDEDRDEFLEKAGFRIIRINHGDRPKMHAVLFQLKTMFSNSPKELVPIRLNSDQRQRFKRERKKLAASRRAARVATPPKPPKPFVPHSVKCRKLQESRALRLKDFCIRHSIPFEYFPKAKTMHVRCGTVDFWPSNETFYCHETKKKGWGLDTLKRFLVPGYTPTGSPKVIVRKKTTQTNKG